MGRNVAVVKQNRFDDWACWVFGVESVNKKTGELLLALCF